MAVARALAGLLCALCAALGPAHASEDKPGTHAVVTVAVPGDLFASIEGDRPTGLFAEVVDAVLRAEGIVPRYVTMATGEALRAVAEDGVGIATVVVPVPGLSGRVHLSTPVITEYNVALTRRGSGLEFKRLADLHGRRIGLRQGYRYPLLDADPAIVGIRHRTDGEMIRCLIYDECDLVVVSGISDLHEFRAEDVMSRLQVAGAALGTVPFVMALSPARFSREDVTRIDKAIRAFQASAQWREIVTRSGLADLVREWTLVKP